MIQPRLAGLERLIDGVLLLLAGQGLPRSGGVWRATISDRIDHDDGFRRDAVEVGMRRKKRDEKMEEKEKKGPGG
jgi:hypothetical protein